MPRQEVALDETGAPLVLATRDEEGHLSFRYLVIRPGGMGVYLPVPESGKQAVGAGGVGDELLTKRLSTERSRLAEAIATNTAQHSEAVAGLQEQLDATGEELEETRAELQVRLDENEDLRRRLAAAEAAKTNAPKGSGKPKAPTTRTRKAAA